jgi:hypothetical protein
MSEFTQIKVVEWETQEVEQWAKYYGFDEPEVIANIRRFQIGGVHLLKASLTGEDIGITDPLGILMFTERLVDLIALDLKEKMYVEAPMNMLHKKAHRYHFRHKKARLESKEGVTREEEEENNLRLSN